MHRKLNAILVAIGLAISSTSMARVVESEPSLFQDQLYTGVSSSVLLAYWDDGRWDHRPPPPPPRHGHHPPPPHRYDDYRPPPPPPGGHRPPPPPPSRYGDHRPPPPPGGHRPPPPPPPGGNHPPHRW